MDKKACGKFRCSLIGFNEIMHLQSFEFDTNDVKVIKAFHPWFSVYIFVNFTENEFSRKFYGLFDHFSGTC